MQDFKSMAKAAAKRRIEVRAKIASTQKSLAALEEELGSLDRVLDALSGVGPRRAVKRGRRTGSKWKPGRPGRPPKWYLDQQKGKGAKKPSAAPGKGKKARKRRKATPKQLAAMAKARAALAAKRKAAAKPPTE